MIIVEESMGAYKKLEAKGIQIISKTDQVLNASVNLGMSPNNIIILPGDETNTQIEADLYIMNQINSFKDLIVKRKALQKILESYY